jgi:AraC-like DNA-binding protein
MDALSEALRGVRVIGAVFFDGEFAAPWGFASPASDAFTPLLAPGTEHVVLFHLVTEGSATARVDGHEEVSLEAGDIVVFPQGDAHRLWNGRGYELFDSSTIVPRIRSGAVASERGGRSGGSLTKFTCGYIGCERHAGRLFLAGLPPILKVHIRGDSAGAWIESSIRHLASEAESRRAGRMALLAKLSEALFVEVLCRYMDELPPERTGWLAAARDEVVGRALALLHREPARAWTLAELARDAGASRTVLSERFAHLVGESPLAYLSRWRLILAARMLETTDNHVLRVALDVGYESDAAFARAFKRVVGIPPAQYRRNIRAERSHGARAPGTRDRESGA